MKIFAITTQKYLMVSEYIIETISNAVGSVPVNFLVMGGGCIADVYKVDFEDRPPLVAKIGEKGSGLALEGMMLRYLGDRSRLPVPRVIHAADELLLMSHIRTSGGMGVDSQVHAAELLAELHSINAECFGFDCDTVIGGLAQPNPAGKNWPAFFRDHRLLYMAREALDAGRLPQKLMDRIEVIGEKIERWIDNDAVPSLIHGDMWGGNILPGGRGIAGFVDPAIYYADAEIELAFSTLFGTFSDPFFRRYSELRPIKPGFFETRRDIYNLYPLLVHVRLFGGHYVNSVEQTLSKFGF